MFRTFLSNRFVGASLIVLSIGLYAVAENTGTFSGTWCVGGQGLVISFLGKDSLSVTNVADESMKGVGTYEQKDTLLFASVANDELDIGMGYQYKIRSDSLVQAKFLYLTVNGDSVNHPVQWLQMRRCDPDAETVMEEPILDE